MTNSLEVTLIAVNQRDVMESQQIVDLIRTNYPGSAYFPDVHKIMKGNAKYFWADIDGERVGMTGYDLKSPTLAETVKTIVEVQHRGKGYGRLVSQEIEDEMKRIGVTKVMSTIFSDNHAMIAIKLKQGYTIEGFHPHHEKVGFHEYSLGKLLFDPSDV